MYVPLLLIVCAFVNVHGHRLWPSIEKRMLDDVNPGFVGPADVNASPGSASVDRNDAADKTEQSKCIDEDGLCEFSPECIREGVCAERYRKWLESMEAETNQPTE